MYRVLDFTRVLAGPWATQVLGDQGFDVIKVESLEGDETRRFLPIVDGDSVYYACTNRNKRSIAIDLKHPEGRALALRLASRADVVVENFRPGVMDRLGLGYADLGAEALVYVSISAFGQDLPAAGYDLVLQAAGGIAALTGNPPRKTGPSIADLASAGVAVQAILFALLERARTGRGKRVDISMLDVQHSLLAYYASAWLNAGQAPPEPSNAHPSIAPYNLYRCRTGWLAICCANDGLWEKLRGTLGLPSPEEWREIQGRVADRARLDAAIESALAEQDAVEWEQTLGRAGIPVATARTVGESLAHPAAKQLLIEHWCFPMPPLAPVVARRPPALGEHTDEILAECGEDAARLRALGVVT